MSSDKDKKKYKKDPDPDKVNDPDNVYQPQQPLTFEKVWLMFQETERFMKEKALEADKRSQETDKKFQETEKRFKETERIVRNISKNIGGLNNNIGEVAEDYFYRALEKLSEVAGVKIVRMGKLHGQTKDLEREFDVVLFGHNTIIVFEVKHKLETKDVIEFYQKSLPALKQLFPEYGTYRIIGGVAGMTAKKGAVKLAIEMGLLVFTQSGQEIRMRNPEGFEPREF